MPVVQSGTDTNIEQIIALKPQVLRMSTMAQTPEQIEADRREIAEHPERWSNVYLMEIDGHLAAYGALFSDGDGVGGVAVDLTRRGRGLGTRMTAFLTRECIRRGHTHPILYCEAGNVDALHVYEKLGYRIESSETVAVMTRTSIAQNL